MTLDIADISNYTNGALEELVRQISPEQLAFNVSKLSIEQICTTVHVLTQENDSQWDEKTLAVVKGLTDHYQIEAVGTALSPYQAIIIFEKFCEPAETQHWKLPPLLVGMPHDVFCHILRRASPEVLDVLKEEAVTEPVQHHLALIAKEMTIYTKDLWNTIDTIEVELLQLNSISMGFAELTMLVGRNEQLADGCFLAMKKLDKALAIAWNTDRPDLIEKLSKIKEQCQKLLTIGIGHPHNESEPATGLYATLEKSLYAIYGNVSDPKDIQALHDEDPAIDALIKFSIWYLQDYVELGLIPGIENAEQLELSGERSEQEYLAYTKKLFQAARESLEKLGLATVGDLKRAGIFSEKTLREYIDKRRKKMNDER